MKDKRERIGFRYAIQGIAAVIKSEWNFRLHIVATIIVLAFAFYLQVARMEWISLVLVIGLVLVSEIFNTVIEKTIDHVKPEYHPVAGFIKDAAAGAVLISVIIAIIVGLIVFLPRILIIYHSL